MSQPASIVAITWDGKSSPMDHIHFDAEPAFDLLLYDYSGAVAEAPMPVKHYISLKSECKGDVMQNIYASLQSTPLTYIGFLDDDQIISVSDLNKLFFIAALEKLEVFQPSLNHDSYYNLRQFLHKPGYLVQDTWWVEIMSPFYSEAVFKAAGPHFRHSISGTGLDVYLIPTIQRLIGKTKTAVVHGVQLKHARPIRTDNRVFSNGKTNLEEIRYVQGVCRAMAAERPELFDSEFHFHVLDRRYVHGVPLAYKIQRIPRMLRNLYKLIVDASYR
jgi:hypothetical protein